MAWTKASCMTESQAFGTNLIRSHSIEPAVLERFATWLQW